MLAIAGGLGCGGDKRATGRDAGPDLQAPPDSGPDVLAPDLAGADAPAGGGCTGSTVGSFADDEFKPPVVQCSWTERHVVMTPLVADLDGDGVPEIVFLSHAGNLSGTRLHAIRGTDCSEVFHRDLAIDGATEMALGDLDGDGHPEIVTVDYSQKRPLVFGPDGKPWADAPAGSTPSPGPPVIADLDGAGLPEVVSAASAFSVDAAAHKLVPLWSHEVPVPRLRVVSLVADLDQDGKPEVVTGNRIFDGMTGEDRTPAAMAALPAGHAAVADMDGNPGPEIVLMSPLGGGSTPVEERIGELRVIAPATGDVLFGPVKNEAGYWGGPPTVADFDGDGRPEIGSAGPTSYEVFDLDCDADPVPDGCKRRGVRWSMASQDATSGVTASSVFDFNPCAKSGRKVEVIYRDECWLRVYEGATGKVLFAYPMTSATQLEEVVVADVDGDGHTEIVASSEERGTVSCIDDVHTGAKFTGYTHGVFVLRDPDDRWAPARPIWNQHTYHVTNVNDDATIPATESASWKSVNSYRVNVAR